MDSPIDYRQWNWPVRPKALDEDNPDFAEWIIYGKHPDGSVDIHHSSRGADIIVACPRELAEQIIAARRQFSQKCVEILNSQKRVVAPSFV